LDSGEGFLEWELERGLLPEKSSRWLRHRYTDYKAGKVEEDVMCGEMVAIHAGMRDPDLASVAEEFFASCIEASIFPEMRQLVERMRAQGCDIWAISSTNDWVVRAGAQRFGIPADRVLAVAVEIENGSITDRLLRIPSGEGKTEAIRVHVRTPVDAAFGNSRWDVEMLEFARQPYVINPNPDLEELAQKRGWPMYFPAKAGARR